MKNRIIALLLAVCVLVSAVPMQVGAAETASVTATSASTTPGSTVSININASNFDAVASLDLYIYYDADVMSVSSTSQGTLFSSSQVSVNTTQAGVIKINAIDLEGISGSGRLLRVRFTVDSDCPAGEYPIEVAVGAAYNSGLSPVVISGGSSTLTVNENQQSSQVFQIYDYVNTFTLSQGDVLTYQVADAYYAPFASADFVVEYDPELFEVDSVELDSALAHDEALYSINTSIAGTVRISYISNTSVSTFSLFQISLKVIADLDTTTTVKTQALNVYQEDLTAYQPYSTSCIVSLQKLPEVMDHPDISLETDRLVVGEESSAVLTLESGAGIAAADFILTYDPAVLKCVNVEAAGGIGSIGGLLMLNENYSTGTIRFSYVNMSAYSDADIPLIVITWEPLQSPQKHYEVTISGVGVVDASYQSVDLDYVTDTGCIYAPEVIAPGCVDDGYTNYTCAACGDSYQTDPVDATGHSYDSDLFQCDNCDHVREAVSVEIESLPTKTEYIERAEELDVSGGVVEITMDDGETVSVDLTADMVSGFDRSVTGNQTLTVTVGDLTASFTVTVVEIEIDHIEIIKPSSLTYLEGSALDLSGGYVRIVYKTESGFSEEIPLTADMISGYDPFVIGTQTLTVSYNGQSATFTVTVTSRTPDHITSDEYAIEDGVILYVLPHITVSELLASLNEEAYIRVFDGEEELSGDDRVTGTMVLKLMDGDTVKDSCTVLLMGDVNHDGSIDNLDATLVLQYAAGWNVTLDLTAADVCSDGNADNLDATLILQYAAGWNVLFEVGTAGQAE